MSDFLAKCEPWHLLTAVAVVCVTIVLVKLFGVLGTGQLARLDADLKREMLAKGLTVAEMERLLAAQPPAEVKPEAPFATVTAVTEKLTEFEDVDADETAQVIARVVTADLPTRQALHAAIEGWNSEDGAALCRTLDAILAGSRPTSPAIS